MTHRKHKYFILYLWRHDINITGVDYPHKVPIIRSFVLLSGTSSWTKTWVVSDMSETLCCPCDVTVRLCPLIIITTISGVELNCMILNLEGGELNKYTNDLDNADQIDARSFSVPNTASVNTVTFCQQRIGGYWCAILIAHQLLWQNMEAPVSIFQEVLARDCFTSTASTVTSSAQNSVARHVTVTYKRLQPLTTTLYNSLVLSFSLLKI